MPNQHSPLVDQIRTAIRVRHYSIRTEKTYLHWIRGFILFHNKKHPIKLGSTEVIQFLSHLAVKRKVSPATQNIALNALVFLYSQVLDKPLENLQGVVRSKKKKKIPVVLTELEVVNLLSQLNGVHLLAAGLLYGSGLRLMEALRLRVKDIDFERLSVTVHNGKGGKDRIVTLSRNLVTPFKRHLENVKTLHQRDLLAGFGSVYLPYALSKKYPSASTS